MKGYPAPTRNRAWVGGEDADAEEETRSSSTWSSSTRSSSTWSSSTSLARSMKSTQLTTTTPSNPPSWKRMLLPLPMTTHGRRSRAARRRTAASASGVRTSTRNRAGPPTPSVQWSARDAPSSRRTSPSASRGLARAHGDRRGAPRVRRRPRARPGGPGRTRRRRGRTTRALGRAFGGYPGEGVGRVGARARASPRSSIVGGNAAEAAERARPRTAANRRRGRDGAPRDGVDRAAARGRAGGESRRRRHRVARSSVRAPGGRETRFLPAETFDESCLIPSSRDSTNRARRSRARRGADPPQKQFEFLKCRLSLWDGPTRARHWVDARRRAMASPDVASRADDDGENDDAWRVGGFRVFGARTSPLRQKRGPLSVQDFLRASAAASDAATDRTPLGRLFPGNAGLHRRAAAASRLRRSREDAPEDRASGQNASSRLRSSSDVPARDPPSPSPSPTPAPAPVFAPAPRAGLARVAWTSPRRFRVRHPLAPATTRRGPPTFVSAIDRALHRAREANGIRTIHPRTPTVGRETIGNHNHRLEGARAVDVDVPHAANASAVDPARVARRRHRRRLAIIVVQQWKWFAAARSDTLPRRCTASGEPDERRYARGDASRETAPTAPPWTRTRPRLTRLTRLTRSRERAALVPLAAFVLWERRARDARLASARLARGVAPPRVSSRAHTPGVARRDVARAASTRAPRASKVSDEGSSPPSRCGRFSPRNVAASPRVSRRRWTPRATPRWNRAFAECARDRRARTNEGGCRVGAISSRRRTRTRPTRCYARAFVSDSRRSKRLRRRAARAHRDASSCRRRRGRGRRGWRTRPTFALRAPRSRRDLRDASRRAFRAWRFESLGVARLARARDARVTRTVTNRWRTTATVSARARSEAETRFATIRLATLRRAAAMCGRDSRARERVVERLADAHASRLCVFSRFSSWVDRVAAVRAEAAAVRFAIETTTRRCVGGWRARTEYKRRRDALRRVAARRHRRRVTTVRVPRVARRRGRRVEQTREATPRARTQTTRASEIRVCAVVVRFWSARENRRRRDAR